MRLSHRYFKNFSEKSEFVDWLGLYEGRAYHKGFAVSFDNEEAFFKFRDALKKDPKLAVLADTTPHRDQLGYSFLASWERRLFQV